MDAQRPPIINNSEPIIPWLGGKRRLADKLIPLFPPYWQTEGYGVPFGFEQYEEMAETMRRVKGKVMVSINDHPDIRRAFDGLVMHDLGIKYSVANAQGKPTESRELVITNYEPMVMGGLF